MPVDYVLLRLPKCQGVAPSTSEMVSFNLQKFGMFNRMWAPLFTDSWPY